MTQGLAKYHSRSPRYILNTEDNSLIRIAGPNKLPWDEETEIRNVSLTGLAFTAPDDLCPVLGEVIKIQFTVPGAKQMACHAIVTRIDEYKKHTLLVGVHFYKLEMAHRVILAQGLAKKTKFTSEHDEKKIIPNPIEIFINFHKFIVMNILWLIWALLTTMLFTNSDHQLFRKLVSFFESM